MSDALPFRRDCTCSCHRSDTHRIHMIACCRPDPVSDIPTEWPKPGSATNPWYDDAAAFVKLVQAHPCLWHNDSALKYLEVRIDTRDGAFALFDREHRLIEPKRVLRAIAKETET